MMSFIEEMDKFIVNKKNKHEEVKERFKKCDES